jgi:hypothetical protein
LPCLSTGIKKIFPIKRFPNRNSKAICRKSPLGNRFDSGFFFTHLLSLTARILTMRGNQETQ